MKTPGSQKLSDTNLPLYQHLTDMALARDVAMLWRALDDSTPEHASFTPEKARRAMAAAWPLPSLYLVLLKNARCKSCNAPARVEQNIWLTRTAQHRCCPVATRLQCKFNHDVEYMKDEALVAKLRSLPDFLELKAFLVEVLEPPPRPAKAQQVTPLKRKVSQIAC